jgi:amino acid permease
LQAGLSVGKTFQGHAIISAVIVNNYQDESESNKIVLILGICIPLAILISNPFKLI